MNVDYFEIQIRDAQESLENLKKMTDAGVLPSEEVQELTAILSQTLEELNVAVEKLSQQNEELSAAYKDLSQERQRYQDLFEFAPDGYIVTDSDGTIQEVNQAAANLLEVEARFLLQKPLCLYVSDHQSFSNSIQQLQADSKSQTWEVQMQPRQGSSFPAGISLSPIQEKDQLVGWRWLIRDLREQKEAEATRQQLEAEKKLSVQKSRFIQTVSHEFRTPLNIIHVSSQLLARQPQKNPEKSCQLFSRIYSSVRHMTRMLEDVLVFHEAELNQNSVQLTWIELAPFCQSIIEEQQLLYGNRAKVHLNIEDACQTVCLNAKCFKQILSNLISNGIQYSSSPVEARITRHSEELLIEVQDFGRGIAPEDRLKIWKPFYRAKDVCYISGIGLGLAIVQKAVDRHQGTITFESEVGLGTTFRVTLPLYPIRHNVPFLETVDA